MAKKLYYKIGEACKNLDIQPYVLRYWETEFPALKPNKSKSGQRVYSEQDLGVIRRIKELLYDEGYTIAGAKKKLDGEDLESLAAAAGEVGLDAVLLGIGPELEWATGYAGHGLERLNLLKRGERPFRENGVDVRSYAMGMRKIEFRKTSRTYLPKRWFDDDLPHTHVALDDAMEQGAMFCNMLAENLKRER